MRKITFLQLVLCCLLSGCVTSAIWLGTEIMRDGPPIARSADEFKDLSVRLKSSTDNIFTIQLGAYANADAAKRSLDRYEQRLDGLWLHPTQLNNQKVTLVLYGRYANSLLAKRALDRLQQDYPHIENWLRKLPAES